MSARTDARPSTNVPSAKPAPSMSAAARTATSSPAASAQADPAHTATDPSPKRTSPDLSTQGDPYAPHLNQRRWWPPQGRSHGHQRAVFITATGQFPLSLDTARTAVPGHAFPRFLRVQQIKLTTPTCRTPPGQWAAISRAPPRALQIHRGFDATYPVTTCQQRSHKSRLRSVFLIPT
jgi:hypothetical protein